MQRILYIVLILILTYAKASAQQDSIFTDTVGHTSSSELDTVKRSIIQNKRADTLKAKLNRSKEALAKKKATVKAKLDKLHPNNAINKANHKLDSLNPSNRLGAAADGQKLDSLIQNKKLEALNGKLDSTRASFTNRLDSLTHIPMPDSLVTKKILALQTGLDSLGKIKGVKEIAKGQEKLNQVQEKVTNHVNNIEGKVNSKFNGFKENGGGVGSLNISGVGNKVGLTSVLPSSGIQPPTLLNNFSTKLQPLKLPTLAKFQLPEANKKIGGVSLKTPVSPLKIPSIKNLNLDGNIPGAERLTDATGEINKIGELGKQAEAYQEDIEKLTKGDSATMEKLQKGLETKLENMDAIKGITGNTNTYTETVKNLETNPEAMQEMIFNNAKEQAVNHFAGHEKELMAAVSQLTKIKSKYKDADTLVDLFKKPENPMKYKTILERLVFGLGIQVQSSTNQWFDFNPYAGYSITKRLSAGFGWMERLAANIEKREFIAREHAFGPRLFAEFKVKQYFHARTEVEYINALVTSPYVSATSDERATVTNYLVGIKKSFRFSSTVVGNVQLMYNVYNPLQRSPYVSNFIVRMGFEFSPKKKEINTN